MACKAFYVVRVLDLRQVIMASACPEMLLRVRDVGLRYVGGLVRSFAQFEFEVSSSSSR